MHKICLYPNIYANVHPNIYPNITPINQNLNPNISKHLNQGSLVSDMSDMSGKCLSHQPPIQHPNVYTIKHPNVYIT